MSEGIQGHSQEGSGDEKQVITKTRAPCYLLLGLSVTLPPSVSFHPTHIRVKPPISMLLNKSYCCFSTLGVWV